MDAIIVGGGVIGLSAAWRAAEAGISVTLVDPEPGRGASWAAAGMLAPVTEAEPGEEALVRLLLAGAARWEEFARELSAATGGDVGYRPCGTVVVAADASDRAAVDHLLGYRRTLGLEAVRLSGSECRSLVPALAPGVRGGAHAPGDHQVDNRVLLGALQVACGRAGVVTVAEPATEVCPDGAGVAVRLAGGRRLTAGAAVVAAGAWSDSVAGVPVPPLRPVKGVVLRLRGETLLELTVRGLVRGRPCYLVPRTDGSLVVGATVEERGFDRAVQAGAVHALLDDARVLVPGIDELELVECATGLRPGTPDNAPYVGWTAVPGVALATGHFRNGILLAPLTAHAVAAMLTGSAVPAALQGFGPDR